MKKPNKLSLLFTAFLLVFSLLLTIGTTYSLWTYNKVQESTNKVVSGCFTLELEESSTINLNNTYPMSDEKGEKTTPYQLTIKNTCSIDANYQAILNILTVSNPLENQYVKYKITGNGYNGSQTAQTIDQLQAYTRVSGDPGDNVKESKILFSGAVAAKQNVTYKLYLWVNQTAGNTEMKKKFEANIFVRSYPTKITSNAAAINLELNSLDSGLKEVAQVETSQLKANNSLRYVGNNPLNYVNFNNETWRVVGIFDVDTGDGNNTLEKRIKIVRDELINTSSWSNNNNYDNSTINNYLNNEYYNTLSEASKQLIAPSIIYLGQNKTTELSANQLYANERSLVSNSVLNINSNVSLLYASDYAYAGGILCSDVNQLNAANCPNNWLNGQVFWTNSSNGENAYYVNNNQISMDVTTANKAIKPAVYLKSNVELTCDSTIGICGSKTNPYTLKG